MRKIIFFLAILVLFVSCKDELYDIPRDENGDVILTEVSSTSTNGISTLDEHFTVNATLPNAKAGDVMTVELLQLQIPSGSTTTQLLPLAGTQKTVTVGSDLTASISYTRAEAKLNKADDYVTVTFAGDTESAKQKVTMVSATTTSKPKVGNVTVDVARTSETAYFNVNVDPIESDYTGELVAQRKNGTTGTWEVVPGSPFSGVQPFLVPISGDDFAVGKDTMFYKFSATSGSYTDQISYTVIVRDPYFYLKKTGVTLTVGGGSAGRNLLINKAVSETADSAHIAITPGSMVLHGGSAFTAGGVNKIEFVATTAAEYKANNTKTSIPLFEAGVKTATADPGTGEGCFIFKITTEVGTANEASYYGLIKAVTVVPNTSITIEYRIGNTYAQLAVIK